MLFFLFYVLIAIRHEIREMISMSEQIGWLMWFLTADFVGIEWLRF
jgi:hypothetical protein